MFYGLDARNVSANQYQVNVGGTGGSSNSSLAGPAFVVPQEWLKQNAGAEAGYRIIPEDNTKLTVGYRYDGIDRSNAQVGRSSTSTGTIALLSDLGSEVNGKLSFAYSDRTGSLSYLTPWANLLGTTNTTPYYSGAFYQAPMTSESVTLRADYTPTQIVSADFFLQFKNENYSYPVASAVGNAIPTNAAGTGTVPLTGVGSGIKQDYALSVGPDLTGGPTNISIFIYSILMSCCSSITWAAAPAGTGAGKRCGQLRGSAGFFQNKDTTSTHTVGVSGDWQVNEKLKLRADYTFSYGSVMFGEYNGVFVANPTQSYQNVSNYPDINSVLNSVSVTATYALGPNVELIGRIGYTSYYSNNWNDSANAIQGAGTTAISILTPGYSSPTYSIVTALAGVKFKL